MHGVTRKFSSLTLAAGACLLLSGCYVSMGAPGVNVRVGLPVSPSVSVGVSHTVAATGAVAAVAFAFTDVEISAIHAFYDDDHRHARGRHNPHGSYQELPPGIRRQVRRGHGLPPGLRGERLPRELERQMRPVPAGYKRMRLGTDIVVVDERTGVVVDIVAGR